MPFEKFTSSPKRTAQRKRSLKAPALSLADELVAEIMGAAQRWDTTAERIASEALRIGLEAIERRSEAYNRRAFGAGVDEEE